MSTDHFTLTENVRNFAPAVGLVLGSGLGGFTRRMEVSQRVPYSELGLPHSGAPGHEGELVLGTVGSSRVAVLSGRTHLYENRGAREVTAGVRLLGALGVGKLFLTNAAGTLNEAYRPGEWMMLSDHINLTGESPLAGGPNFVDMSEIYTLSLRARFLGVAAAHAVRLHVGIYAGLRGPQYETPAEIRMLRVMGADAVGMSTVLEAIQARALGMEVAAFSCLTNWASGMSGPLSHSDVMEVGRGAAGALVDLLEGVLQ
ncbi:MAG: purine-nucleoside phosphorylase [Verrucomicrobiales bacterium]|nr:purine-nucleoside phosphorylase [Verrucomicrobiales bacterium]